MAPIDQLPARRKGGTNCNDRQVREVVMRQLRVFNSVSLDGYFTDTNNDYSWAHAGADDPS